MKPPKIQEWKHYASHNGGTNNLAVCRLNHPGDGAAAIAVGTSLKNMEAAVKNAYRNLRRHSLPNAIGEARADNATPPNVNGHNNPK